MLDDARSDENQSLPEVVSNSPEAIHSTKKTRVRLSEEVVKAIRLEYLKGGKTIKELALLYNVNIKAVEQRAWREGWRIANEPQKLVERVESRLKKRQEMLEKHEERMIERMSSYFPAIDASRSQCGDLIEPSDLKSFVSTESTVDQVIRRSLGAQDKVDITSDGKSLGSDLVGAVQKLYASMEVKPGLTKTWDIGRLQEEASKLTNEG